MRIYEYAKQVGLQSKDLLNALARLGYVYPSHMAFLSADVVALFEKTIKKEEPSSLSHGAQTRGEQTGGAKVAPHAPQAEKAPLIEPKQPVRTDARVISSGSTRPEVVVTARSHDVAPVKPVDAPAEKIVTAAPRGKDKDAAPQQQAQERFSRSRETVITPSTVGTLSVAPQITVAEFAELLQKQPGEVIFVLLKRGIARPLTAQLSWGELEIVAKAFEVTLTKKVKAGLVREERDPSKEEGTRRLPIVVVMGHVDHGKTTLLDYLRKTTVAAREHGGITQHLGAYEVRVGGKNESLIFLDTPGHEAFSYIRTRGAQITDIVVIIVAAHDGVQKQTLEAISLAKAAGVPIVVAINKMDKVTAESELDPLKTSLSQQGLTPEEWGGQTVCVPISAKTGKGVDTLLEMLQLHAELLDLRTRTNVPAKAFILETRQVKGHGWVATVICKEGTLRKGDYFVCGGSTGRVKLLIDSHEVQRTEVGPSEPIQIIGFDSLSNLGDWLEVVDQSVYNEAKNAKNFQRSLLHSVAQGSEFGDKQTSRTIKLILKTDTQGSCHALVDALTKIAKQDDNRFVAIDIVSSDIGPITEGDVLKAVDTGALLYGLHVKPERNALTLAKEKNISITTHTVIYRLLEEIEERLVVEKHSIINLVETGTAKVLKCFSLKGGSVIAGALIVSGELKEGDKVVCMRNRKEVGSGIVKSLQRDKKSMAKVLEGQDCGFVTDSFHDWQPGDKIVIYTHEREA